MKLMNLQELYKSLVMYDTGNHYVTVTYLRNRDLSLKADLFVMTKRPRPGAPGMSRTTQLTTAIDWKNRFSTEPLLKALTDFINGEGNEELMGENRVTAQIVVNHIQTNRNARRRLNTEIYNVCGAVMHEFEKNPRIKRNRGQFQYHLWESQVIDLEKDETPKDAEHVKLGFVKYNGGFNLALHYRFLVDGGSIAGKIDVTTNQPETIAGLYGQALEGIRLLRKRDNVPQRTIDEIVYHSQRRFLEDEGHLEELLYRHHTNNV